MADEQFIIELAAVFKDEGATAGMARIANALGGIREAADGTADRLTGVEKKLVGTGQAAEKAKSGTDQLNQSLSTSRYALYDVSRTLGVAGAAMLGLATATFGVAIAFERDFAQVARTTGIVGPELASLRQELVDLSTRNPISFSDIAEIASLAGQLGVATENIASFAETVAQFSATTDLSVDAAATAFGRLDALLPDIDGKYESLGSSILRVGVNSVATESQIVAISTQIASMGNFAGLTTGEVIGLSGALASVGAAPEISRGTITRTFTLMSRAIAGSGDKLDEFARIAGVSSDEFSAAFGTPAFGAIFQKFLTNLGDMGDKGQNVVGILNDLGITSVRDVPLLLRLAGAQDVVNGAFSDGRSGMLDATELSRQYGVISQTTAAKLQVLGNALMGLLDAAGSGNLGPLSDGLDILTDWVNALSDMARDPYWGALVGYIPILAALVGALALAAGGLALMGAASIGLQQALLPLIISSPRLSAMLLGTSAASKLAAGSMTGAAAAATVMSRAFKLVTAIGFALLLPEIARGLDGLTDKMLGVGNSAEDLQKRLQGSGARTPIGIELPGPSDLDLMKLGSDAGFGWAIQFQRGVEDVFGLGGLLNTPIGDLKKLDDALVATGAAGKFDEIREALARMGVTEKQLNDLLPETAAMLRETGESATYAKGVMPELGKGLHEVKRGVEGLLDAEAAAAAVQEQFAASIGLLPEELDALKSSLISGSQGFFDFAGNVNAAYEEGGGGVQQFMSTLDQQIIDQGVWADNIAIITARGGAAFATELAKMGPAGAALAADAVNLTAEELGHLEDQTRLAGFLASQAFADAFAANTPALIAAFEAGGIAATQGMITAQRQEASGEVPGAVAAFVSQWNATYASNPIKMPVDANTAPAQNAIGRFLNQSFSKTVDVYINQITRNFGDPVRKATGGPIYGPGSGTSDSIPAMLSNGEYVIKASTARKLGTGYLNALNSGRAPQQFAAGGPTSSSRSGSTMMGGVMELGPKTISAISREVNITNYIDDVAISRAAERGNKQRRFTGDI